MRLTPRISLWFSARPASPDDLLQRARRQDYGNGSAVLHDFNAAQRRDVVNEPAESFFAWLADISLHNLAILAKTVSAASLWPRSAWPTLQRTGRLHGGAGAGK